MPFSTTAQNQQLDALAGGTVTSIIGFASLHKAYSGTGASELAGGGYGRQSVTWSAAAGGTKNSASVGGTFSVAAGGTVAFVGLWAAGTVGAFAGMGPNGGATQFGFTSASGTPSVYTAPNSAYSNGDTVALFNGAGDTVSSDFTIGNIYFVVNASGATFSLSASSGGGTISSTHVGSGIVQGVSVETYAGAGSFTLTSETLTQI